MKTYRLVELIKEMGRERLGEDYTMLPSRRRTRLGRRLAEEGAKKPKSQVVINPKVNTVIQNR
jgi:hypothetical protein